MIAGHILWAISLPFMRRRSTCHSYYSSDTNTQLQCGGILTRPNFFQIFSTNFQLLMVCGLLRVPKSMAYCRHFWLHITPYYILDRNLMKRVVAFVSPIPKDLLHKSDNAHVPYPIMHHFVTEMCICVHISVTKWSIMGCLSNALRDLLDGPIVARCLVHMIWKRIQGGVSLHLDSSSDGCSWYLIFVDENIYTHPATKMLCYK